MGLLLVLPIFSQAVFAQNAKDNWDEVMKIKAGSKLSVKIKTGQKLGGKVTTVTAESITLSTGKTPGRDLQVRRQDVAEIRRKSGARTAGYAALLGGVGMAGGYGIGYGVGEATDAPFAIEYQTMAFGAAVGAAVGAILGSRGEVIFKAP
jgi:hypothetical protein